MAFRMRVQLSRKVYPKLQKQERFFRAGPGGPAASAGPAGQPSRPACTVPGGAPASAGQADQPSWPSLPLPAPATPPHLSANGSNGLNGLPGLFNSDPTLQTV